MRSAGRIRASKPAKGGDRRPGDEYRGVLRRLDELAEEMESLRAYIEAKLSGDEAIPFEQAVEEIERRRK